MRDAAVKARRGGAHRSANVRWWQVVSAVVPITLVASAWGVAIAATPGSNSVDATSGKQSHKPGAPAVTDVPTDVFEQPTARTTKKRQSRSVPLAGIDKSKATPASLRSSPLPSAAIDAYRDAATVMADVKSSCKLDWTLIAAIGRVESNHGQYSGSTVSSSGDAKPKIIGIPLDGTNETAAIHDTDGGTFDGDTTWDRAVGPMQFIPSTWDLVGVDGNGDGDKDPNNVYDAALASAVYLCADGDDLSTEAGASEAVFSYNHSRDYVATVLAIAEQYGNGNFSEEPSVYLPETDADTDVFNPDTDTFDPDANTGDGRDDDTNTDTTPHKSDKLERSNFGGPEKGNGGKQRIQSIHKHETSPKIGGSGGNDVAPVRPDEADLLEEQNIQTGPKSGRPTNPKGQSNPETTHGFADNKSGKSKQQSKKDRVEGFKGKAKAGTGKSTDSTKDDTTTKSKSLQTQENEPAKPKSDPKAQQNKPTKPKSDLKTQPDKPTKSKSDLQTQPDKPTKPKSDSKAQQNKPTKPKSDSKAQQNKPTKPESGPKHKGATKPQKGENKRPKHRKLGSIKNSADQTERCADGAGELRAAGTDLSDDQADQLVGSCVEDFDTMTSISSEDPILTWMTAKAEEL